LQIFSPEVTLIRDQVLINVGAYEPKSHDFVSLTCLCSSCKRLP